MKCVIYLLFALVFALQYNCTPIIPIPISPTTNNESLVNFSLTLPNNDTIQIGLSFRFLTYTSINDNDTAMMLTTQPTPVTTTTTTTGEGVYHNYVSVTEAIEGFRQQLIKKEIDIAGIIESSSPFYRHFKLEFDNDEITIRCTYDSNYHLRALKISCYEYHEFETERILANGEVEYITQHVTDHLSDIELVDLKKMKQTYSMNISKK